MGVAHLSPDEMAYFSDSARRYPPAVLADQRLREYAERVGGLTLRYWQLALGRVWGQPYMMTVDEAASRLGLPISQLQAIDDETNRALGWATDDPDSARSREA